MELRRRFDLYANVRPAITVPGTKARYDDIDIITVRENTEGAYGSEGQTLSADGEVAQSLIKVTRRGSERIVRYAFELARRQGRKKVTVVHKANIMKTTSGLFLKVAREVAAQYPDVACNEMIVDNTCMQLVMNPHQFDVIVTTNLFGDIISDLCAGLVGGLGLAPGANIGTEAAIFEAVHGSAPDIAGRAWPTLRAAAGGVPDARPPRSGRPGAARAPRHPRGCGGQGPRHARSGRHRQYRQLCRRPGGASARLSDGPVCVARCLVGARAKGRSPPQGGFLRRNRSEREISRPAV